MLLSFCCSYYESGISKDLYVFFRSGDIYPWWRSSACRPGFLRLNPSKKVFEESVCQISSQPGPSPSVDFA